MASESLQCKTLALRVSIHCEGCKKKVKKVLQSVEGVYRCDIDARGNKATVAVTGRVNADALVRKLRKAGKQAERWPEEHKQQQQQQPNAIDCQEETKNQTAEPDKPGEPAEKPASGDAEANDAEPSDPKASTEEPKKMAGEATAPAQESTESTNAGAGGDDGDGAETGTVARPGESKRKRKQQQQQQEEKAVEAMAPAAASGQGSHTGHLLVPVPLQQLPVHVMSYSVARPSACAAYYAAAPAAAVPEPVRPPAPQEHSPYYTLPSPYRCYYDSAGHGTPQRSAASPARDSYGDLFSDDNANSCAVM